jgi:hypothetical protein
MTLQEISQKYKIPEKYLQEQLKIARNEPTNIKLGHLKKKYNITMSDVSRAIETYYKN